MHVKLDELLRAVHGARTELVDLENVNEEELTKYCDEFKDLHLRYARVLAKRGHKLEIVADDAAVETDLATAARLHRKPSRNGRGSHHGNSKPESPSPARP
jgi:low affinity Fe/Cu permease